MHIRYWTQADLPVATTIVTDAGLTDSLVRYWAKDIDNNFDSYRRAELNFSRQNWRKPGRQCLALIADRDDWPEPIPASQHADPRSYKDPAELLVNGELVVGIAWFERLGTSEQALRWRKSLSSGPVEDVVERALLAIESKITGWIPNYESAVDRKRMKQFEEVSADFDEEIFAEAWEIGAMYIHPNYHRRGYGKILLDWVFKKARDENVPVICRGSPVGGLFYAKNGFRSLGEEGFSVLFNETEFGGVPHQLWVWEPEGSTDDWFERAKKRKEGQDVAKSK